MQGKNPLNLRTKTDPRACTPAVDPSLLPLSADGLFMGYTYSTKVIIYFDPKTLRIKITFHFYVDDYDVKLHPG